LDLTHIHYTSGLQFFWWCMHYLWISISCTKDSTWKIKGTEYCGEIFSRITEGQIWGVRWRKGQTKGLGMPQHPSLHQPPFHQCFFKYFVPFLSTTIASIELECLTLLLFSMKCHSSHLRKWIRVVSEKLCLSCMQKKGINNYNVQIWSCLRSTIDCSVVDDKVSCMCHNR
jgi:hypothetical protein